MYGSTIEYPRIKYAPRELLRLTEGKTFGNQEIEIKKGLGII